MKISLDPRKEPTHQPAVDLQLDAEIRRRAYELYALRGGVDGHELDDWLQAEAETLGIDDRAA